MTEYDDLFSGVGRVWKPTQEQHDWLAGLADQIVEHGQEPTSWNKVYTTYLAKFKTTTPKATGTIVAYVRNLVAERG